MKYTFSLADNTFYFYCQTDTAPKMTKYIYFILIKSAICVQNNRFF